MAKYKRSRLLVDKAFQLRLLVRMGMYFVIYMLTMLHVGFVIEVMQNLASEGLQMDVGDAYLAFLWKYRPLLFSFVIIAPILVYDLLKFSNRVAGPLYRCRRIMLDLAEGKPVTEFVPRKGDFMKELFEAFNVLIKAVTERRETEPANRHANGKPATSVPAGSK